MTGALTRYRILQLPDLRFSCEIVLHYVSYIQLKYRFSFGYDQGVMGGVNVAPDYVRTMKLGFSTFVELVLVILSDLRSSP